MSSSGPGGDEGGRRLAAVARRAREWSHPPGPERGWPVQRAPRSGGAPPEADDVIEDEDAWDAPVWPAGGAGPAAAAAFRLARERGGRTEHDASDGPSRLWQFAREHLVVLLVVVAVGVVFAVTQATRSRPEVVPAAVITATPGESVTTAPTTSAEPSPALIKVHVLGAVVAPGVVILPVGARVEDAVAAAGGYRDDADPALLNLASVVTDGAQVVVGTTAAPLGQVNDAGPGGGAVGSQAGTVLLDLNTATQAQLEALPGIGPVKAASILAWRDRNGRFTTTAELQEVDGIGPKTFAQLEPYVTV